jgi:hypothetical protein
MAIGIARSDRSAKRNPPVPAPSSTDATTQSAGNQPSPSASIEMMAMTMQIK